MTSYRRVPGVAPPLFDRLVDNRPLSEPPHLHDSEALRASIARELSDLLNTRVPVSISELEQRARRTAIDYGIPDLTAFPPGEHAQAARLAEHLAAAVRAYEPRLRDPSVRLVPNAGQAGTSLAELRGTMHLETRRVPVSFAVPLCNEAGVDDAL
jgi:type VI secretion system lysozyme-like protein